MRFFSDRGLAMDLTPLYEEQGWNESIPAGFIAASQGADGLPYFVPTTYYWWAVYYRPSIFQEVGIETVPETWDDFMAAIETLKGAGKIPITIGTKAPWTAAAWFDYLNMRTNGPEFHIALMEGQHAYNSEEVKATFANWRQLLDAEAFIAQPEAMEWQDAVTPLAQGEAAMYLMGAFIRDSYPDEGESDLDFFRFPLIADVPIGEDAPTDGYFAAAKAGNVEGAMALLAYLGGAESQEKAAVELKRIAVNSAVPLDLYAPEVQKGIEMLQGADFVAQFYDRDTTPEMAEKGMAAFVEFWNDPDAIDAILDGLEAERERIFGPLS
jgi:multiple sugar transport system substrate-binding protein/raffinose/stachyose/melibiose transport system substrate-binding protein